MDWQKIFTGKKKPKPSPQPEQTPLITPPPTIPYDPIPELPNYDPKPADGVRVGESPVPGLTLRRVLRGHTGFIGRIAWSPDGNRLGSSDQGGTLFIWDPKSGKIIQSIEHKSEVDFSWAPDGNSIVACTKNSLSVFDLQKGSSIWQRQVEGENCVSWSPMNNAIATGSDDGVVRLWNPKDGKLDYELSNHRGDVIALAWSFNGQFLASGGGTSGGRDYDQAIRVWDVDSRTVRNIFSGHTGFVADIAWSPNSTKLASVSMDKTVRVWDADKGILLSIIEAHTNETWGIVFSPNGLILVSHSWDNTLRFWNSDTLESLAVITLEAHGDQLFNRVTFKPDGNKLAIVRGSIIQIWDLEIDPLIHKKSSESIRYTTAKLVLVGDWGVGKTGLGWRLAHGKFKEHSSTHGQQFWMVDDLCTTRTDGTKCEAVLWDLAGQHVYRQIHSIFLDNVDASLVLFDPSNRQEPFKGAQFWMEQLKGKGLLPPTVLVGARVDVSPPALSQQEFDQFCQRYGIQGGYVSTSAKRGDGLDALLDRLRAQIPWDKMTTTVTTVTFKRIKDYVLALKEKPDRQGVLVRPTELRRQLQETDPDWEFTDAEMMTAVGHLQTHGYVTILKSSSGETYILLMPDLLVDLASSIVLLADKHPRELGAVSETELLQGRYPFDELAGLEENEQHILLDAAVLRFLDHSICLRETFGNDTLLIFPGLIKQKRPLEDDFPATDDVSYIVRGRVDRTGAVLQ